MKKYWVALYARLSVEIVGKPPLQTKLSGGSKSPGFYGGNTMVKNLNVEAVDVRGRIKRNRILRNLVSVVLIFSMIVGMTGCTSSTGEAAPEQDVVTDETSNENAYPNFVTAIEHKKNGLALTDEEIQQLQQEHWISLSP